MKRERWFWLLLLLAFRPATAQDVNPMRVAANSSWNLTANYTLSQATRDCSTSLVGYWSFDEGSGSIAYDQSGNGNDGTIISSPVWVDGVVGGALQFDGIDDYVTIPDSPTLDIDGQEITFMTWINPSDFHEAGWVMGRGPSWGDMPWWFIPSQDSSGVNYGIMSGGATTERPALNPLHCGSWSHVAVTYDGEYMRCYFDAVCRDSFPKTGNLHVNDYPMFIARDGWIQWKYFPGMIDEVKVYNRALTLEEIRAEVRSGFECGDADGSGGVDIDDVVFLINYIFAGGPEPTPYESGDANCSGGVDIDDVVYLINYIFSGGNAPCDTDGDEVPDC